MLSKVDMNNACDCKPLVTSLLAVGATKLQTIPENIQAAPVIAVMTLKTPEWYHRSNPFSKPVL